MSFLDSFDVDKDQLDIISEAVTRTPRSNDRRICICGHPMSRHDSVTHACKPAALSCPCKRKVAVIEVPNTRYFLAKTTGSGMNHALARGIFMARNAMGEDFDERAKWLVELRCENPTCGKETKLFPIMTDEDGFRIYDTNTTTNKCSDKGVTAFLCEDCREVYFDDPRAVEAKRNALRRNN